MPVAPTYPGVYVEEIPSGVRTITGVATSITAFVGRAARGPVNEPVILNGFADFERRFGGLGLKYPMSYAVRDFFLNGGAVGLVVRLYGAPSQGDGSARFIVDGLQLKAATAGGWGNKLRIKTDLNVSPEMKATLGLADGELFNLTVTDTSTGQVEKFLNLTIKKDQTRRVDKVLSAESNLVRWDGDWPAQDPPALKGVESDSITKGDAVTAKAKELQAAKNDVALKTPAEQAKLDKAKKDLADAQAENPVVQAKVDAANAAIKAAQDALDALKKQVTDAQTALQSAKDAAATSENASGGQDVDTLKDADYQGSAQQKSGLYALLKSDLFNLLCVPPDTRDGDTLPSVYQAALQLCVDRRAMLLVDSPAGWSQNPSDASAKAQAGLDALGLSGTAARNAALFFPRVRMADTLQEGRPDTFIPSGIVAGVMARTDTQRGVWKAPAGLDAALAGILGLDVNLSDGENGQLNPLGINCLRAFPVYGRVVWGARTLRGADALADEYKYIPVRRLALYIEESLFRGTKWVVFEPNDEPLWAQIRLNIGAFMHNLFRQGAFQGTTPKDAYFVKCDHETTNQTDVNLGIVNIVVGFAPLKPAEFVIIKLQQIAGKIDV
jgi:phage tail sheath protein FI